MNLLDGGTVTSPLGYVASGVACGLKESGNPDLVLLGADRDCTAAGVFTQNQIVAAPVVLSRETLTAGKTRIRGIVANAGNANACTGKPGMAAAQEMQRLAAEALACQPDQVLILSTGVIGVQLDMTKVGMGISAAAPCLSAEGGAAAAEAIMTTDTRPKQLAARLELPGGSVTVGGMAKGSGMIHPDMATMLAVITTDAAVPADELQASLSLAVESSFNRISVDGDTSTNDTVLLLANGASGVAVSDPQSLALFQDVLSTVCRELAQMIVRDGEGATKFVELVVTGAHQESDALAIARTIATSPLVKTALTGGDPNWGRILAAAGRAGVPLDPDKVALSVSSGPEFVQLVLWGLPCGYQELTAAHILSQPAFQIHLDLGLGDGETTLWTCDLSHDYVSINADYRT